MMLSDGSAANALNCVWH